MASVRYCTNDCDCGVEYGECPCIFLHHSLMLFEPLLVNLVPTLSCSLPDGGTVYRKKMLATC